jgi:hypothetical protein
MAVKYLLSMPIDQNMGPNVLIIKKIWSENGHQNMLISIKTKHESEYDHQNMDLNMVIKTC